MVLESQGIETDTEGLTYNPSTGKITSTGLMIIDGKIGSASN